MNNAEWIIKTGHSFKQLRLIQHNELANRSYTVMLCDEPIAELSDKKEPLDVFRKWLDQEHKEEPILDDAEKRYLKAVIRPFRTDVQYIAKLIHFTGDEEIIVSCNYNKLNSVFSFDLPPFEKGTMYKGMEPNKDYTLEELGL